MRLPRELWWIAGLTLFMFALIWLVTGGKVERGEAGAFNPSTYSSDPQGTRAFFLTLQELGYDARRFRSPFSSRTMPKQGTLVIVEPTTPVAPNEWNELRRWIEQGHTALLASSVSLPGAQPALGTEPVDFSTVIMGGRLTRARPTQPTYLARGIEQLSVRSLMRIPVAAPPRSKKGSDTRPSFGGLKHGTRTDYLQSAAPLFCDDSGVIAAYCRLGRGDLIVLASSWSVSNDGIGRDDNLLFLLNALGPAPAVSPGTAPVYFDEYHHGYAEHAGWRMTPLPLKLAAAQLLLGMLIVIYARSRRFGSPIPLDRGRRERSEYLGTMTSLLQKGHATRLAVRACYDSAVARLRLELGLPHDAGSAEVSRAAMRVSEDAGRRIERSLRQCELALRAEEDIGEPRAMAAVRSLDDAVRSLRQV